MDFFTDAVGNTHFINLSTRDSIQSYWDFGDGYHSNDLNPIHSYSQSGVYNVCLNVLDTINNCETKVCNDIYIQIDSNSINCSADSLPYTFTIEFSAIYFSVVFPCFI